MARAIKSEVRPSDGIANEYRVLSLADSTRLADDVEDRGAVLLM